MPRLRRRPSSGHESDGRTPRVEATHAAETHAADTRTADTRADDTHAADTRRSTQRASATSTVAPAMLIASAWGWRILAIAAVLALVFFLVSSFSTVVVPLLVALLLSALLTPLLSAMRRRHVPHWLAVVATLLVFVAAVGGLITLVVLQTRSGFGNLREQTLASTQELETWLRTGPLQLTQVELSSWAEKAIAYAQSRSSAIASGALTVGTSVLHLLTGLLLTLFTLLFFLIDGRGIWQWILRLLPRRARPAVADAAMSGWRTLSVFVRAQLAVAGVNALGIGIGAAVLQLPLALPVAVVVFLGSFVPIIGAIATGAVAVVIALVYSGWVVALVMLGIVIGVHLLEGHVLQPLVLGTAVKVHPLAVVLGVATGLEVAGIAGALFAVPLIATANTMITSIARRRSAESAPVAPD